MAGHLQMQRQRPLPNFRQTKQLELLQAFYSPQKGIGYTLARTNINSCDFSSDSYTYVAENDKQLKTFNIDHDRKYKIPLIKKAIAAAGGKLSLFVSPWSPPAWMKDNNNMLHGGKLKDAFADAWANYYVKFIQAYEKENIPVWGLTVQNEPMATQHMGVLRFYGRRRKGFYKKPPWARYIVQKQYGCKEINCVGS